MRDSFGKFIKGHIRPPGWNESSGNKMTGKNNPFFGKKHTLKSIDKIKKARAKQDMSYKIGSKHSEKTKRKMSIGRTGAMPPAKHWSWKGGITPVNTSIRQSAEYKRWREAVFRRDDYICQDCGQRGGELQADHELPFALFPDLRFEVLNGRTFCVSCHRKTPTYCDINISKKIHLYV